MKKKEEIQRRDAARERLLVFLSSLDLDRIEYIQNTIASILRAKLIREEIEHLADNEWWKKKFNH